MELLNLAWKNLWRSRRRTLITLAAVSFSLMLVQGSHNLSFGVYSAMIDSGVRAGTGHLVVYQRDYVDSRDEKFSFAPQQLVEQIGQLDGVEAVLPRLFLPGLAQSTRESRGVLVTGVDSQAEQRINPFLKGMSLEQLPSLSGREAVVGSRLLKELQLKPGNKFVVTLQSRDGELVSEMFRVHSVVTTGMKNIDKSLLLVGRERAARLAGIPGEIQELAVVLRDQQAEQAVYPKLQRLLKDRPQLRALSWTEAMPNLSNAIKLDYASSQFIFIILLLIVTIGVINTLLMSVMERFKEFGVILAVGASALRLRILVFAEAFLLGVVAMVLGSVFGSLLTWYLQAVGIDLRDFMEGNLEFGGVVFDPIMRASWDWPYMLQIAFFMLLLSLVAAIYPAIKAGRILPAEALRHH
ncbi:ABC transporter permease [Malonomonas rubra]|uniref:ABC transporter permease n=1 Tax=Malonomonas rubra TaxID=57040 RepID=UPI0026EC7E36|nr:FtsX-like permease family protein [Malonomonas rubra]